MGKRGTLIIKGLLGNLEIKRSLHAGIVQAPHAAFTTLQIALDSFEEVLLQADATYSLHCSSFFWLDPIIEILVNQKKELQWRL